MASPVVTDEQLIDDALAGETAAFGQLVLKYQDRLYHTLSHVLGSPEDASDVAQDAFVQAFLKLETFKRTAAFYTWLYRIALNLAASRRRGRRHLASIDQLRDGSAVEPVDHGDGPDGRIRRQERAEQVQAALGQLNEEYRVVLILREMEGCCYETIAQMLDLPVGTVRSRLHRARLQMRDHLKEVLQEDVT